jgi:hypothetical protein
MKYIVKNYSDRILFALSVYANGVLGSGLEQADNGIKTRS